MRYAELHCLSNFSFLRGASHPAELVQRAAELGYEALALTDRNSLAGVVRGHVAAGELRDQGRHEADDTDALSSAPQILESSNPPLKLIIGAEITPVDAPPIVLLAPGRAAYGRLSRLITCGRLRTKKGACRITLADVAEYGEGLIGIVLSDEETKRRSDEVKRVTDHRTPSLRHSVTSSLFHYRDIFAADNLFLAAELRYDIPDDVRLAQLSELSKQSGIPLVAANAVHYHVPQRRYLQDALTCIRERCTLAQAGSRLFANAERHLRSLDDIELRYTALSDTALSRIGRKAIEHTVEIARRCTFSLDELRYEYPHELVPPGVSAMEYLEELTWEGALERYVSDEVAERRSDGVGAAAFPSSLRHFVTSSLPPAVTSLLQRELALIAELRYEHYFLTVHDLVRFARSRGILCQGRGSAANSAVCYCLGITAVDPTRIDLLFERFISKERNEPPDIDIDFEHERREEVFQYIYQKYGRERAAITGEVICYRARSAVRDIGKVLGMSLDRIDVLAKSIDWYDKQPVPPELIRAAGLDPNDRTIRTLVWLVRQLLGFPRHLSQHVGGFVITETPLCEIVPLENGALPNRTFIEWDKDDIDALGILKVDCLALGMLTAISKCFTLLNSDEVTKRRSDGVKTLASTSSLRLSVTASLPASLFAIPPEDPHVYDMICRADTVGVFQIESRAQMSMLPRLRPRCFYDLVIEVAIVRPGPIQGGMVHPYLRRRHGREPVEYPSEAVKQVLAKTLGVPIFQEQVMRLAVVAAGFTPGEADQLRRSMAAWKRGGAIEKFQTKLIRGMLQRGYRKEFAEQIYKQIRGFGEYGFPESHSASFSLIVYASAWLKRYHPAAFTAGVLNSQPMGFYAPAQLVRDSIQHGVEVRVVDVNWSGWDCALEERDSGKNAPPLNPSIPAHWGAAGPALRLGMRLVRGLSEEKIRGVVQERRDGLIRSIRQLARRADVSRETLLRLAAADAFRSLGLNRREALWRILAMERDEATKRRSDEVASSNPQTLKPSNPPSLFAELEPQEEPAALPAMTLDETVVQDYDAIGMSLNAHPIGLVRGELDALGRHEGTKARRHGGGGQSSALPAVATRVVCSERLKKMRNGQRVAVAGLVLVRQRPSTAGGIVFMTLEDETGIANLIVRPNIWDRDRTVSRGKAALVADGVIQREGDVIHVMVRRLYDLSDLLATV